jgi:hypothetical protein
MKYKQKKNVKFSFSSKNTIDNQIIMGTLLREYKDYPNIITKIYNLYYDVK